MGPFQAPHSSTPSTALLFQASRQLSWGSTQEERSGSLCQQISQPAQGHASPLLSSQLEAWSTEQGTELCLSGAHLHVFLASSTSFPPQYWKCRHSFVSSRVLKVLLMPRSSSQSSEPWAFDTQKQRIARELPYHPLRGPP